MADSSRTLQVIIQAKDEASKVISSFGSKLQQTAKDASLGAGIIAASLGVAAKSAISVASDYQQARVAFEGFLGSGEKAGTLLANLSDFAVKTPFNLPQVIEGGRSLLAYGVAAESVVPTFRMLGDLSQGNSLRLDRLTLAFGQVKAATRLTGQELRQFTESGVPLIEALAKHFGVAESAIRDMVSEGTVGFKDVEATLGELTGKGGRFFNAMELQSKTFAGRLSNARDEVIRFTLAIMGMDKMGNIREGSVFYYLQLGAERLMVTLQEVRPAIEQFVQGLLQNQTAIFAMLGGLIGLFIPLAIAIWATIAPALLFIAIGLAIGAAIGLLVSYWPQISAFFQGIITSIQTAIVWFTTLVTVTIPAFITGLVMWFQQLPTLVGALIYNFFVIDLPYAIGYFVGYVYAVIPQMVNAFISFMSQLPPRLLAIMIQVYTFIVTKLTETWAWVSKEVSQWPGKVEGFLSTLPALVGGVLDSLKKAFFDKLNEIWGVVMGWKDKVVGAFNAVVDAVNRAIDALKRGFSAGVKAGGGGFQHGGFIPGSYSQPVPAILHGGERVIPRTGVDVNSRGSGMSGGLTINFSGPVSMDSEDRVQDLADRIINIIGRQSELANKGVSF